jgi:hypothetical protein
VQGRLVAVLFDDWVTRGVHQEIVWDGVDDRGRAVPSGVYFCRAVVDGRAESTKLVLLK